MFCKNCGAQNNDYASNCANCGAPLNDAPQNQAPYVQPQYQQPLRQAPVGAKPTVLYIIGGAIAALLVLFAFLPQFTVLGKSYNAFTTATTASVLGSTGRDVAGMLIALFIIPMAMQIVWAILSFMQKRPAGIFGIVSCAIGFFVYILWSAVLGAANANTTVLPTLMILLSIGGLVVSILQVVKKKYL